ncbi:MAG: LacI family DNA-binding transcriptional regulator [Spirochaetaceae bacterium]
MATIKDIAERTAVSITTVSRVLNYDKSLSISKDKRQLILEVAEELEYETPRNRKNSRSKKKKGSVTTIGILHFITLEEELEDPYYIAIRLGIEKTCMKNSIQVIKFYNSDKSITGLDLERLDGLIVVGEFLKKEMDLINRCKNVVFIDSYPVGDNLDSVIVDLKDTVIKIIDYLVSLGFKNIGYIGGIDSRKLAFTNYMTTLGLFNSSQVFIDSFTPEGGYIAMQRAIDCGDLPEVFFAGSDSVAIGVLKALYEAGLRVPDDISVIGLNDIPTSKYSSPPLTTFKIYSEFMGECGVELLLEKFAGRIIAKKLVIPTKLVTRDSLRVKK